MFMSFLWIHCVTCCSLNPYSSAKTQGWVFHRHKTKSQLFSFSFLDMTVSIYIHCTCVWPILRKKWGSYQGEKPFVHSKNIISETQLKRGGGAQSSFLSVCRGSEEAAYNKQGLCDHYPSSEWPFMRNHSPQAHSLAVVCQLSGDLSTNWLCDSGKNLKGKWMVESDWWKKIMNPLMHETMS